MPAETGDFDASVSETPLPDAAPANDAAPINDAAPPVEDASSPNDASTTPRCGASAGVPCAAGSACSNDDDCEGLCTVSVCTSPTATDGRRSLTLGETDIDCGGASAPACDEGRTCRFDRDCSSRICSASNVCVSAPSCRGGANGTAGIDTCGVGEVGAAEAKHESCCRALPLPARPTRRLDRYEITSGRFRVFMDAITASFGGVPNVRAYAKAYAMSHPDSQLADVAAAYPGLIDILPDHAGTAGTLTLPVHLGAFPLDPLNTLDGCYVGNGSYGHPTYWQPPSDLKNFGIGALDGQGVPDGTRSYSRQQLDEKPLNCVMPLMMAAFCAWDGGELARTRDYHEIWGRRPVAVGSVTAYVPWNAILSIGQFNFRNGHGEDCTLAWPGCAAPQPYFYRFPLPHFPQNDDTPAIAAPGRFPLDVTAITSANGEGWFDIGGNLLEAAWLSDALRSGGTKDFCDTSASPGPGETPCLRRDVPGVLRYAGEIPHMALAGYSFEGHDRRGQPFLSSAMFDESLIPSGDLRAVTFQYGKVGGRCARSAP